MKQGIHPEYVEAHVHCSCGETFMTRATTPEIRIEICSKCHPFYSGKQKLVDTGGRVQRFQTKFGDYKAPEKANKAEEEAAPEKKAKAEKAERKAAAAGKAAVVEGATAEEGAPEAEALAEEAAPVEEASAEEAPAE